MEESHYTLTITRDKSKERLDKFLTHALPRVSRSFVKQPHR